MIHERLRVAVESSDLKQKEFALKVGHSPSGFNAIVRGHKNIGKTLALAVQALSGYSAEWILTGEGFVAELFLKEITILSLLPCNL